jgi:hypothetical protein
VHRLLFSTRLFALFTLTSLLATSCAEDEPTFQGETTTSQLEEASPDPVADGDDEPLDSTEAVEITVRLGIGTEWTSDPADAGPASLSLRVMADLLHQGLTELQVDGSIGPGLADRWFVTEDRLTWTFVLSTDLTDGLGMPLSANDIKLSLEGVAARGVADQAATSLNAIRGWKEHANGDSGEVSGISALDVSTLVIELLEPFEMLADVLASPAFGITGRTEAGEIRTTGAYRYDGGDTLVAVDDSTMVTEIKLVQVGSSASDLLDDDLVDWVVLPVGQGSDITPGDIVRQPLDLRVAIVVRLGDTDARRALLGSLVTDDLTADVLSLNPLPNLMAADVLQADLPETLVVDVPEGSLLPIGLALEATLSNLGVDIELRVSSADEFATLVASGQAVFFPLVVAGGSGSSDALLRVAGGVDDVTGSEPELLQDLIVGVAAEQDSTQRRILVDNLEGELRELGLMLLVGQFEVRVGIGPGFDGLRHRSDGTLDLSQFSATS